MVEPSILYRLWKVQQMAKELVDGSKFYPDMFWHMVAILKGVMSAL
jgi:hypothetical protein